METVEDVMRVDKELLWGDIWEDSEFTFTVKDFRKAPILRIKHSDSGKEVIYYTPLATFEENKKYFIKQDDKITIHLPKKAIGDGIVRALISKELLDGIARITIFKKSFKKARVITVCADQTLLDDLS